VEQIIRIGMDTSKHIFQLHGVDASEQPVLRKRLGRKQMEEFFAKLPPTVVGIEACGASHYWARELGRFGHEVKLMAPHPGEPIVDGSEPTAALRRKASCPSAQDLNGRQGPDRQAALLPWARDREALSSLRGTLRCGINADFFRRVNAPSDQLAPDGRLPGTAEPTLDTQGEER
jgi:transposase